MKRILKFVIIISVIVICAVALASCNDVDEGKGKFTYTIYDEEGLNRVKGMLGSNYAEGRFELDDDITIEGNWEPIGTSMEEAFCSTFDGNGHTITYNVYIPEPVERDTETPMQNLKFHGLFGIIHNARIKDLNVVVNIQVPANGKSGFLGGLAGFMSCNNVIENVTVSGNIHITMGNICQLVYSSDGSSTRERERIEMTGYVGGLAGFINGETSLSDITSNVSITVDDYNKGGYRSAVKTVCAGGIVGSVRTNNLSSEKSNKEYCTAKNLTYNGDIKIAASEINAGGIFGSAYRVKEGKNWIVNSNSLAVSAYKRVRVGGVAGIIDRVDIDKTKATVDSISVQSIKQVTNTYSIGGVIGYAVNYSNISNAIGDINTVSVAQSSQNYVGGVVGTLNTSNLNKATAKGSLLYGTTSILNVNMNYAATGGGGNVNYIASGGVIGRLYGESVVSNVATVFTAFQGIVGEAERSVDIVSINVDEGETIDQWLANTMTNLDYVEQPITPDGEKDEDGEQRYRIIHNYSVDDATCSYLLSSSKVDKDIINPSMYVDTGIKNNLGTSVNETTAYDTLLSEINSTINS